MSLWLIAMMCYVPRPLINFSNNKLNSFRLIYEILAIRLLEIMKFDSSICQPHTEEGLLFRIWRIHIKRLVYHYVVKPPNHQNWFAMIPGYVCEQDQDKTVKWMMFTCWGALGSLPSFHCSCPLCSIRLIPSICALHVLVHRHRLLWGPASAAVPHSVYYAEHFDYMNIIILLVLF